MMYLVGFVLTWAQTLIWCWAWHKRSQSPARRILEANLAQAGLFWSDDADSIVEQALPPKKNVVRHFLLMGALFSGASWLGFIGVGVVGASVFWLARSRQERALLDSRLAAISGLSRDEVLSELNKISGLTPPQTTSR